MNSLHVDDCTEHDQDGASQLQLFADSSGDLGNYEMLQYIEEFLFIPCKKSFGSQASFVVKDTAGQKMFTIDEQTEQGLLPRSVRKSKFIVKDSYGLQTLIFQKSGGYEPNVLFLPVNACYLQEMTISTSANEFLGTVVRKWTPWVPQFDVIDFEGRLVCSITGPRLTFLGMKPGKFILESEDEMEIGKISKHAWSNLAKEIFTETNLLGVRLYQTVPLEQKPLLMGAALLMEYLYHF